MFSLPTSPYGFLSLRALAASQKTGSYSAYYCEELSQQCLKVTLRTDRAFPQSNSKVVSTRTVCYLKEVLITLSSHVMSWQFSCHNKLEKEGGEVRNVS